MVEQLLAAGAIAGRRVGLVAQQVKSQAAVAIGRADDDQGLLIHMVTRPGNAVGQSVKRVGREFLSVKTAGKIVGARGADLERSPSLADLGGMLAQGLLDARLDAIEVNMKLALASREAAS